MESSSRKKEKRPRGTQQLNPRREKLSSGIDSEQTDSVFSSSLAIRSADPDGCVGDRGGRCPVTEVATFLCFKFRTRI